MLDAMKTLEGLSFTRPWGSAEELKAAKYIQAKLSEIKIKSTIESFKLNDSKGEKISLKVKSPYEKQYDCIFYKLAGNANKLNRPLVFIKDPKEIAKYDIKGKIALLQDALPFWTYKDLVEGGCEGIIVGNGQLFVDNKDILQRELRESLTEVGKLPVIGINNKDLYEMVQKNAEKVEMTTIQKEFQCTSQNVVAKIPGEVEDTIVFTAHYDSTKPSLGAWDNGSGSIGLIKIAEYFSQHKPHQSLIFVWCGAEERGLNGSKAYVKRHTRSLDKIKLCINLDMIGSTVGKFLACVTGEEKLAHYIEYMASEKAKACHTYQDVYSSDSTPFADKGIPAVSFGQGNGQTPIHCRFDTMQLMHRETLEDDINFIIEFADRMANAKVFPVKREMPDNMKEKLDQYLLRKRP